MLNKKVNHLKWGVILTYVSLLINIILSILYTPLMLKILGQSEHGLYSTVSSTMSWLSLLGLGIGSSYIKFFAKYKVNDEKDKLSSLNGLFLLIFVIIGAVCMLCGLIIANNLGTIFAEGMTKAEYITARKLAIVVTIDMSISFPASVFSAIIRANEKFIQSKVAALFQNICTPLITLPLLLSGYGSVGMVAATTVVDTIAYTFNAVYCFKVLHSKFSLKYIEEGIMGKIFGFSVFIAINSLIAQFATGLDKLFITRYVNTAAASVYAIGCSLYSYYSAFSGAVTGVFAPRIFKLTAKYEDDKVQLKKVLTEQFIKLGRIQFIIQMLMLTGIIFFGQAFIHHWAERGGQDYSKSYYIALLLCASSTVPLIQNIGTTIQQAQNMHRYRTYFYAVMTAMNVVLTIWLCQVLGAIGAAVGTAASTIALDVIVMNIFYEKKLYIDIVAFWKTIILMARGLIAPIVIGIFIRLFYPMDTILKMLFGIMVYAIMYCLSMWFFVMNGQEKEMLIGQFRKYIHK